MQPNLFKQPPMTWTLQSNIPMRVCVSMRTVVFAANMSHREVII